MLIYIKEINRKYLFCGIILIWCLTFTNPLLIKTPDDHKWKVYFEEHGGYIWLGRGWDRVKAHYKICYMDAVFFSYCGGGFLMVSFTIKLLFRYLAKRQLPIHFIKPMVSPTFRNKVVIA